MSSPDPDRPAVPRRVVINAVAAGLGVGACGRATTPEGPATAPVPPPETPPPPPAAPALPTTGVRDVAPAGDIPVGGGRVFPELRVVVTQPVAGEFRGFGIVCTHDGCELTSVSDGTINCPCHGSRFALTDGSVVRGPARTGLRVEEVAVDGDRVVLR